MVISWKRLSCQIATDELTQSDMRLAGGQKQNRTFPSSIHLLESLLWFIRPRFGGFP